MNNSLAGLIEGKSGNNIGVLTCLTFLSKKLSPEDFRLFCDKTPDGVDLWRAFTDRRDAPDAPQDYGFTNYAKEVLQKLN